MLAGVIVGERIVSTVAKTRNSPAIGSASTAKRVPDDPEGLVTQCRWNGRDEERAGTIVYLIGTDDASADSRDSLAARYDKLRKRFLDRFYFSGRIATEVDRSVSGGRVVFGDQTIYMGQALMAFSTEMAVRRRRRLPTDDARKLIAELLDGIEELERKANTRYQVDDPDQRRGLIVRDDISGPSDSRLGGRFREVASDWQHPEKENASPSGDQLFGLMFGLYAVKQYSGDRELSERAARISERLFEYARETGFVLRLPNKRATRRGSDMRWLASLYHGLNKTISGKDYFAESYIEIEIVGISVRTGLKPLAAFWDSPDTARAVAELAGKKLDIPRIGDFALNSFALHILLMSLAPSEVWSQEELERAAIASHHPLAILAYCAHHKTKPKTVREADITKALQACPESGPSAGLSASTGWQHDNRWIRCTNVTKPNSGSGEYNGLDWLLLYNFRELVFGT